MSFIAELRRRNVLRIAGLYLVGAWLAVQVASTVLPAFEMPVWVLRAVITVMAIGFLPALIFAWIFELTPEGLKREKEVDCAESITPHTGRRLDRIIMVVLALALGYFTFDKFVLAPTRERSIADSARSEARGEALVEAYGDKSIAVLPFVNMSADKEQEYFSDGISEELLNLLTKIPQLRVTSRSSAFSLKGQNLEIREIARRLNVAHVLEGSVRKSGNRARITAQLIDARSDTHLWAETYDRPLDDIFAVQDEIAREVVKALKLTLLGTTSVTRSRPVDPGLQPSLAGTLFPRPARPGGPRTFGGLLPAVAGARFGYAPAWAGLAQAYARQADYGFVPVADGYQRARDAAEKALALDPQLGDAHLAMGSIQRTYDWDWEAADASHRRALELEPGSVEAIRHVSNQAWTLGHWSEAIDLANKAIERDPLRPNSYSNLARPLLAVNRNREAEAAYRKALELDPGGPTRHLRVGTALLLQGKTDAALREMHHETEESWRLSGLPLVFHALGRRSESDAALAALKDKYAENSAYQIAEVHAFRGEADLAFEWLERAYVQRDSGLTGIKGDPLMRGLAADPRYKAFLKKMRLPE